MQDFKAGDWVSLVRDDAIIFDTFQYTENYKCRQRFSLERWEPIKGDWVVIKPRHPHMHKEISFTVKQFLGNNCNGVDIEPFLGRLPTFIRN